LNLTIKEIEEVVNDLEKDSKALKKELYKLCWYMRGSLSVEEAFQLDFESREIIVSIIDENLKTTEKTKMPFF
jgi:hypothetical protein